MQYYALPFLFVFLGALALAASLTPVARVVAVRWGAIDKPSGRKIHSSPIPRLGGLAIWVAIWSAALLLAAADFWNTTKPGEWSPQEIKRDRGR